jgi:hypothetical protein
MKVYVVIAYNSLFNSEEIDTIYLNENAAAVHQAEQNCLRVEEHEVIE